MSRRDNSGAAIRSSGGSQASARFFVERLIHGELGSGGPGRPAVDAASSKAFLRILQQLSGDEGRRGTAADESAICDQIAANLMKQRRRDAPHSMDRHLRFHGLRKRLQAQPSLQATEVRFAVLHLLYMLRNGGTDERQDGADEYADIAHGHLRNGFALDPFPAPSGDPSGGGRSPRTPRSSTGNNVRSSVPPPRLGSEIAGARGGAPSNISEPQLLRDLLHAIQGIDSKCFRFNQDDGRFEVASESYILTRPVGCLVQRILELGSLHMKLCEAARFGFEDELEADGRQSSSLLHQALCEALNDQLRDYYKALALLMAKAGGSAALGQDRDSARGGVPELTLRRLWTWLQAPLENMRLLVTLSMACIPLRGGALASAVHGFSTVGDPLAQEVCVTILRRVVTPLLSMIRAWMTEGELQDPFLEFFVCADASVPLEDLWTRMYTLEIEMVPRFVKLELARKILLTGKSVNFIRLCCPGQDWLSTDSIRPGNSGKRSQGSSAQPLALPSDSRRADDIPLAEMTREWPLADLPARVEQAAMNTNKQLVALLMGHYALGEHCLALRRFMLLGQGDFMQSLMDNAQEELHKDADKVYRHELMGILEGAIQKTNAQFCPADVLARLGVRLLTASTHEPAWDVFLLEYSIDQPIKVVFTPHAMHQYEKAFRFLWKLRRVSHELAFCWSQHMALQRHMISSQKQLGQRAPDLMLELRTTLHKCTCLRNEMHHFVQNIHSYVMCEVLETSWAKLQSGWQACTDLDQVILEHNKYLACLEEGAFLAPKMEPILTELEKLFGLALEFTGLHGTVFDGAFELLAITEHDTLSGFAKQLAEMRVSLDQIGAGFLMRLQALLKALEVQPSLTHLSTSDLRFLICRLDFNGYYETKRTAPFDQRRRLG